VLRLTGVPLLDVLLTLTWVVGVTNAFNLLDNMDGLASGMAVIAGGFRCALFLLDGDQAAAAMTAGFVGAVLGFLVRNAPPARIFMGDAGSLFLGFFLSGLCLVVPAAYYSRGITAVLAVPVLLVLIPIFDTTFVTVTRLLRGQPVSQGGRDHTSHRLVLYGLSEKRAVLLLIGASAALATSAVAYARYGHLALALVGIGLSTVVLVHFGMFLVQARGRASEPVETTPAGGWLSIDTYRLHKRRLVEGVIDLILIVAAYYLAYVLRYDGAPDALNARLIAESLPFLVAARYVAFLGFGLYRGLWRYAGGRDVANCFSAVVVSEAATVAALTIVYRFDGYSRSVFVTDAILCFMFIAGSRLAERGLGGLLRAQSDRSSVPRALIVGAGDAGNNLLRELRRRGEHAVVGFIDDDVRKRGARSQGARVLGSHREIEMILDHAAPEVVYVTIPDAPEERLERIEAACRRAGARYVVVRTLEAPSPIQLSEEIDSG